MSASPLTANPSWALPYLLLLVSLVATGTAIQAGEYNVILDNTGPCPQPLAPIQMPTIDADPIELPSARLPVRVPRPRTIRNQCRCVKTLVRAQPVLQVIRVPIVRRYLQTISEPVVETIGYRARPINPRCNFLESQF